MWLLFDLRVRGKRVQLNLLEQTMCIQRRPEPPRLQLSLMHTQLSQSGSLPSAHFLYLALRKAQRDHCPAGASMPEMLSALTQTRTRTCAHQYILITCNKQHMFIGTHILYWRVLKNKGVESFFVKLEQAWGCSSDRLQFRLLEWGVYKMVLLSLEPNTINQINLEALF